MAAPTEEQKRKLDRKIEFILTPGLAALAIVGFISFFHALKPDIIASETGLASELFEPGDHLLADPNTYASLLLNAAADGRLIDFVWIDADKYASVIGWKSIGPDDFDYLVVDINRNTRRNTATSN